MAKPITIPNTFANATTAIPLSQLDNNYSTISASINDANTYSNYAADSGAINAYAVTLSGVTTTYTAGLRIQFKAANTNSGASTLNVNSQGAKNIYFNGAAISANVIQANAVVDVIYDGTQFQMVSPNGTTPTSYVAPNVATTFTATQTFVGSTSNIAISLSNATEPATVSATAATGNITYDIANQSVLYYTSNASANWNVLFRYSSGTTLNTAMAANTAITAAFLVTQGATAYYNANVYIDGTQVTPKWQGGTAPTSGNANATDAYTYTIVKTAANTYTVFASQTQFK